MNYSTKYTEAFDNLMILEGGKTKDTGGWTNYGITLRNLIDSNDEDFDKDHDGDLDKKDLWAFTREDAKLYIWRHWWQPAGFERILAPAVATKILDICFNVGMPRGIKIVQKACNNTRTTVGALVVDGKLGKLTLNAINTTSPVALLNNLRTEQRDWYTYLITVNPAKYAEYKKGWMRRART